MIELAAELWRLGEEFFNRCLPLNACYIGLDLSSTMLKRAQSRTARFGARAAIQETSGTTRVDPPDGVFDRFIFAHREGHREQAADATDGQLAECLATDVALQLFAKLGYPGIGRIDALALPRRPAWTAARTSDFIYEGMNVWLAWRGKCAKAPKPKLPKSLSGHGSLLR